MMKDRTDLAVMLTTILCASFLAFISYWEGKRTADRWWQSHPGGIQAVPVTCKEKIATSDDCQPVPQINSSENSSEDNTWGFTGESFIRSGDCIKLESLGSSTGGHIVVYKVDCRPKVVKQNECVYWNEKGQMDRRVPCIIPEYIIAEPRHH